MGLLLNTQDYYRHFFVGENWNDDVALMNIKGKYNHEKMLFFKRYYDCLLNSKICNECCKTYIKSAGVSMRRAVIIYNDSLDKEMQVNLNTGLSKINYLTQKLDMYFTDEKMISKIFQYNEAPSELFESQLNEFISEYGKKLDYRKNLIIHMPAVKPVCELSEEKFDDFLDILRPYSKSQMSIIQTEINTRTEEVGYIEFIMHPTVKLNSLDSERKNTVLRWLGKENQTNQQVKVTEEIETEEAIEAIDVTKETVETVEYIEETVEDKTDTFIEDEIAEVIETNIDEYIELGSIIPDSVVPDIINEKVTSILKDTPEIIKTTRVQF